MKKLLGEINCRLDTAEEEFSAFEDTKVETAKIKAQRKTGAVSGGLIYYN